MISGTFILFGFATALIYFLFFRKSKWEKSPPGPKGLPVFGNLFQLDKFQHVTFGKFAKEYGPIYKLNLMNKKMVVVSDYKLVKEMFSKTAFSGRMDFSKFDMVLDGKCHGIINSENEHWEELRHWTLRQLRDFGFGKATMEEAIIMEVNDLINWLKEDEGKPVENVKQRLLFSVVNSLWAIVAGKRFHHDDKELLEITEKTNESFTDILNSSGAIALFVPWLLDVFPKLSGYENAKRCILDLSKFFWDPVKEHKKTFAEDNPRDFVDRFLEQIKNCTNKQSAFYGKLGEENLMTILSDLYFAGTDTSSSTLSWLMLYLSKMPEIQKKFQKEIEAITGNTRQTSVADRPNMPYTEALLAETLRYSSITPQGVQHRAVRDEEFGGYLIPKDTIITSNLHYIHYDPKIWGDPENFRPERFLSPDGKTFKKHEALMPFSIGRRQCLGESLARDTLFLMSTNIFQRFEIQFDKNGPDHGYESKVSFILTPKPFNLIFKDRMV